MSNLIPFEDQIRTEWARHVTRRHFLNRCQVGLGALALGQSLGRNRSESAESSVAEKLGPLSVRSPHHAPKAKRVIYLHMSGSPPQQDLFDWKPALVKHHLEPCPDEIFNGERFAFIKGRPVMLGTPWKFARHGQSGQWVSEVIPGMAKHADDMCIINSMITKEINHAPAELFLHTGENRAGGAAIGAWTTYGLGSENQNLPGFVVLVSGGTDPTAGKSVWGSGVLPSVYQGVQCRTGTEPIFFLNNPDGMTRDDRRRSLDALKAINEQELTEFGDPETRTRIEQYELAFRMQTSVPEVMDIGKEDPRTLAMYGAEVGKSTFANNCLLARRMVEQGVRYVQLFDWGWDMHGTGADNDIVTGLPKKCRDVDKPIDALLTDLKQRGMLDDTLVVWGGEFGRTSMNEARGGSKFLGRDHHIHCFSIWMAGGGVKPGITVGSTDELGYRVSENAFEIRDLQATILHLLGLDPFHLSYKSQGLNTRLIGPADTPKIRREILA
ncbi:MAG: DUF1501 domain-containing protein [Planctomycetota bacterium]|nr:MAG: DUF1501 domain-containing protein [Planctomycetota bacterium]